MKQVDASKFSVKCKCKHTFKDHQPNGSKRCKHASCKCQMFNSDFLCVVCDGHFEEHETVFETSKERKEMRLPVGQDYIPFAEVKELQNVVFNSGTNVPTNL